MNYSKLRYKSNLRNNFCLYITILYLFSGSSFINPLTIRSQEVENINKIPKNYIRNIPRDDYILGPGDIISVNVSDEYPELKVERRIDGEGTIYLPRLKRIYVSGLSINELNELLNKAFLDFVKFPSVEVSIINYRVIRISVKGEINNPGIHLLEGSSSLSGVVERETSKSESLNNSTSYFPTLFDAIRESGGITEFSDLKNITIRRNVSLSRGGGQKMRTIDLNSIFISGDLSQNIRIYDGDVITVKKSQRKQIPNLRNAISSNLNPKFIQVLVSGRVNNPGALKLPKSSVLSDAMGLADIKFIKGKLTFVRFNNDGSLDKRKFNYSSNKKRGSYYNPILKDSDIIVVGNSAINVTSEVISEITNPFNGLFSTYSLIKAIQE